MEKTMFILMLQNNLSIQNLKNILTFDIYFFILNKWSLKIVIC